MEMKIILDECKERESDKRKILKGINLIMGEEIIMIMENAEIII